MGYSGVKGGMDAVLAAERLVRRKRAAAPWSATTAIIESYRLSVDRIMGESGLYDEAIAADAFRQAEGDPLEAAHLVRAYRSSLPRLAVSTPADPDEMSVLRRTVPAGRTPGGPQFLGRTTGYTARVLEVRHGRLPVRVIHPLTGNAVEIGRIRATEAEAIEDLDGPAEDRTRLDIGYGLCFGHNERKAIAMANLDIAFRRADGDELELATRVIRMEDGQVVASGTADEILGELETV